jgi:hypothetical protein
MATKKNGVSDDFGTDQTRKRPFWGDPENLKSAGARADDVPRRNREAAVNGRAPDLDMTKDFVAGHDGWPEKVRG